VSQLLSVHSSVIDIGRYFSTYFTCRCGNSVTVPTLEFDYLFTITLTFFSVLSPSHFILALWQSCVLSTVVLINEYELDTFAVRGLNHDTQTGEYTKI